MATNRPKLTAVLGPARSEPIPQLAAQPNAVAQGAPAPEGDPRPGSAQESAPNQHASLHAPKARRAGRRASGHVQLNVLLPEDLRRAAKIKAMRQDREISEVVEEFLTKWVSDPNY